MHTELLPMERTCDLPGCQKSFTPPTGIGTTPYLCTDAGGKYFCSSQCREQYKEVHKSLADILAAELAKLGVPQSELVAHQLMSQLRPEVTELSNKGDSVRRFKIRHHPLTSLMSCILSADSNFENHSGTAGTTQSLMRIADFACVISLVAPGSLLREIHNVKLKGAVPLGQPVIVRVQKHSQQTRNGIDRFIVESLLEDGTPVSRPTTVTTYTP